ncbi:hypothetical protein [Microbacterium sp. zg.Y909]|uniref:hypothetical protein n=1 Tax=Microbacterium sp. zg.Y909 TaxID=2969413 RepID=UPI00214CAC31|nr:hypothetical protein [Microbacterium sp. zg.Y909]MCR2823957.1 hypothetical protein [Microbacterium sp. zg.Y909]
MSPPRTARTLRWTDVCAVAVATAALAAMGLVAWTGVITPSSLAVLTTVLAGLWLVSLVLSGASSPGTLSSGSTGAVRAIMATLYPFAAVTVYALAAGLNALLTPLAVALILGMSFVLIPRALLRAGRAGGSSVARARALIDDVTAGGARTEAADTHTSREG